MAITTTTRVVLEPASQAFVEATSKPPFLYELTPAEARKVLESDGFACKDGNRPDGAPVPVLECERVYSVNDNVHSWTVKFWPNQPRPEAHYVRLHMRDPNRNYNDSGN